MKILIGLFSVLNLLNAISFVNDLQYQSVGFWDLGPDLSDSSFI